MLRRFSYLLCCLLAFSMPVGANSTPVIEVLPKQHSTAESINLSEPLYLAVFQNRELGWMYSFYQPLVEHLKAQLGRDVVLKVLPQKQLRDSWEIDHVDMALLPPWLYFRLDSYTDWPEPSFTLQRNYSDRSLSESSAVLVAKRGPGSIKPKVALEQIIGKTVATPTLLTSSGCLVMLQTLNEHGIAPKSVFWQSRETVDAALAALDRGEVDYALVPSGSLESLAFEQRYPLENWRVLHPETENSGFLSSSNYRIPEWPLVLSPWLTMEEQSQLHNALLSFSQPEMLEVFGFSYEFIPALDYKPVQQLLDQNRLPPFVSQVDFTESLHIDRGYWEVQRQALIEKLEILWIEAENSLTAIVVSVMAVIIAVMALLLYFNWGVRRALQQQMQSREEVFLAAKLGTWESNFKTGDVRVNSRYADILGYTVEELEPASFETWEKLVHPEDKKIADSAYELHLAKREPFYECEYRMRHKSGKWVWILDRGQVMHWTRDGQPLRMSGTHQDITKKKERELKLDLQMQRVKVLQQLPQISQEVSERQFMIQALRFCEDLTSSQAGVVHLLKDDNSLKVIQSESMQKLLGHQDEEELYPLNVDVYYERLHDLKTSLAVNCRTEFAWNIQEHELGGLIENFLTVPIWQKGKLVMLVSVLNQQKEGYFEDEITSLEMVSGLLWRTLQERCQLDYIEKQRSDYRRLVNDIGGNFMLFSYCPHDYRIHYISESAEQIVGNAIEHLSGSSLLDAIHWCSDSPAKLRAALTKMLLHTHRDTTLQLCVTNERDSSVRHLNIHQHGNYQNGELISVDVLAEDVTEEMARQLELKMAENVFEHASEGIIVTDGRGKITRVNRAFMNITEYRAKEVLGLTPRFLLCSEEEPDLYKKVVKTLLSEPQWQGGLWSHKKSGAAFYLNATATRIVSNEDNQLGHYMVIFNDTTELKRYHDQLEREARYDELTGLPNRGLMRRSMHELMQQANQSNHPMAVMFIDLDGFKAVNDTYGHDAGDVLLIEQAQRMQDSVRQGDVVARLAGDEFVLLLPNFGTQQRLQEVAQRLIENICVPVDYQGQTLRVSASVGVAIFSPGSKISDDQLLGEADEAMYKAKRGGKNSYHFA